MSVQDIPEAIQWHEGMLLTPQHFQQLSLRHEALLHYYTLAIAPFCWGVRQFRFDAISLVSGVLRVLELEAVMPDGLIVWHSSSSGEDLKVDLTPYSEEMRQKALTVHLAVAARSANYITAGDLPRYDSYEGEPVADENTGSGHLRIPRLKPRLSLLVTEVPAQKYVSFPLMKVSYRNEAYVASDFIPPSLDVPLQSPLGEMCSAVARRLREKAMFLAEQARSPSSTSGMPYAEAKQLIQSLTAALPPFEAMLHTGVSHPYILYLGLCSLAGHLATVGTSLVPPVFAPYNHNDLRSTFEQTIEFISRMIAEGISEAYTVYPFRFEDGVYSLNFEGGWAGKRLVLGMRAQPGMTEKDIIAWGEECLIGSRTKMQSMRERRVLGAARERLERDEEIIPTRGVVLFSLTADREFIEPNEVLQILNTGERAGALRPAEIVLYVMNFSTGQKMSLNCG